MIAAGACRDDNADVLAGASSRPGNYMFSSEWLVGSGRCAAVNTATRLDLVLQLPMQGYLRLGSRHSAPRVTMVNGCADPGDLAALTVRDWCQLWIVSATALSPHVSRCASPYRGSRISDIQLRVNCVLLDEPPARVDILAHQG